MRPIRDNVLVEPEPTERDIGLIHLPDEYRDRKKPMIGHVVAVGNLVTTLKKGDRIILLEFGGTDLKIRGRDHRLVKESDVIAKLED